jgi:hypothetical protein
MEVKKVTPVSSINVRKPHSEFGAWNNSQPFWLGRLPSHFKQWLGIFSFQAGNVRERCTGKRGLGGQDRAAAPRALLNLETPQTTAKLALSW